MFKTLFILFVISAIFNLSALLILFLTTESVPIRFLLVLKKVKNGTYSDAENDAIDLKQLFLEEQKLRSLFKSI
ncbi:MAG: hypothetical protein GF353_14695 [Candidatus Lokiarchaeota archaeon]|nr:hypothetical protein [Candidatus Lokiarchaeota archaeon]